MGKEIQQGGGGGGQPYLRGWCQLALGQSLSEARLCFCGRAGQLAVQLDQHSTPKGVYCIVGAPVSPVHSILQDNVK